MTYGKKQVDIREDNKRAVIELMLTKEMTLADLEQRLLLSHTALNKVVGELVERGIVYFKESRRTEVGRPSALYDINSDCGAAAVICFGAGRLEIMLVDMKGYEINRFRTEETDFGVERTVARTISKLVELKTHYRTDNKDLSTLVVSIAADALAHADLATWERAYREHLAGRLRTELIVKREFECVTVEEQMFGRLKDLDRAMLLSLEGNFSAALYASGVVFGAHATRNGNLNSLLPYAFWAEAARRIGVSEEACRKAYRDGEPACVAAVGAVADEAFRRVRELVELFDVPCVLAFGKSIEEPRFADAVRARLNGDAPRELRFLSFSDRSPAAAGAVWLGTYNSILKLIRRA